MKKTLILSAALALYLLSATGIQARVLMVFEQNYFYCGGGDYGVQYIHDVQNIDFKQVDWQIIQYPDSFSTQARCRVLWTMIRDEYQQYHSATNPDSCLEGVVLIGNLPMAWRSLPEGYIVPDDRYFMDIYNSTAHTCYTTDSDVWDFDRIQNVFTNYQSLDTIMDIWVSRIMAHQIRGLRKGLDVMDEYWIINSYFERVHERMTMPAKVPPRGFAMGWISQWAGLNDPITKLGFDALNLQRLYKFDTTTTMGHIGYPASTPANWLLQLLWGPYGGTTLGAFNGSRNNDFGPNHITIENSTLHDLKSGTEVSTLLDTLGYEWAGIYEHSCANLHAFNQVEFEWGYDVGSFFDATLGPFWWNNWRYYSNNPDTCYGGSYYKYNTIDSADPWYTNINPAYCNYRRQAAIFTKKVLHSGDYRVYMYYPAQDSNSVIWEGAIADLSPKNNYSPSNFHWGYMKFVCNQKTHSLPENPGSNWEQLIEINCLPPSYSVYDTIRTVSLTAGDSVRISFDNNCSPTYLIADAIKLVDTSFGRRDTIIIDNDNAGEFSSDNWYSRSFMDMQDEDMINHAAYSKVPFFVSAGCQVGNYFRCYDPDSISRQSLTIAWENDLGLLYGMAHSGLISLTSAIDYNSHQANPFYPFTQTIAGKDACGMPNTVGDGLRAQYNHKIKYQKPPSYPPPPDSIFENMCQNYSFIGAGTLRPDTSAYVPYGTLEQQVVNVTINIPTNYIYPGNLVWMQNFNVTSTGNSTVQGSEIRIYSESDLQGEVDIKN